MAQTRFYLLPQPRQPAARSQELGARSPHGSVAGRAGRQAVQWVFAR